MHPVVELAKSAVEAYVREGRIIEPPAALTPELAGRAGVFICLKKRRNLRGCIGTFEPAEPNVAREIIRNAISSACQDPRFHAVTEDELPELEYTVDLLSVPEKISNIEELDPRRYGVIVVQGIKRGLLLPDLEGVDTVEEQLRIAKMKAFIHTDDNLEIFRFRVTRFK